ncbi:MAG: penicillin acylase family protein [Calditrichaeota bacterium]|nr:MAG: penicillin acylase family protein [Calditrichota bacterium]
MPQNQSGKSSAFKWITRIFLLLVVLAVVIGFYSYNKIRQSLPILEGELSFTGISTPVTIERDALGVPTISSTSRTDIAYATGFVHAQERFFQMDLLRRRGAGELAELFGAAATKIDRESRIHRFRSRSQKSVNSLSETHKALLTAYKNGVNEGLAQLDANPFEYIFLGQAPVAWRMEDSFLCVYAMYFTLQSPDGMGESNLGLMHDLLPPSLFDFLTPAGTIWDAAIDGTTFPKPPLPAPGKYYEESEATHKKDGTKTAQFENFFLDFTEELRGALGSNNWVVSGAHSESGSAIVCNDMHLMVSIPNTWYRASFNIEGVKNRRITGVTLPGLPFVVTGSNSEVAWGFTNSYGDWGDLVILEMEENETDKYKTPNGFESFVKYQEIIKIKDAPNDTLNFEETIWGPVIDTDYLGRKRAYRWVAHTDRGVNLHLYDLEQVSNVDQALAVATHGGIPAQNFVTGDKDGNIGWTIVGAIPNRIGDAGRYPQSWADGKNGWDGWLSSEEYPKVVNPESGRIWTANARVVGGKMGDKIYDYYNFTLGARSQQIRDLLMAKDKFVPGDMVQIQRDHRAVFLTRWQKLLLETLDESSVENKPNRQEFRKEVENWGAMASPTSVGFRLVKNFRRSLAHAIFDPMLAGLKQKDSRFSYISMIMAHHEQAMWDLVTLQPDYMLMPGFDSWKHALLSQVDSVIAEIGTPLSAHPWSEENTFAVQHPFGKSIPALSSWLDIPEQALPGGVHMPLLQTKRMGGLIGASERFAVSPGLENEAYFHMPAGQSGHPMSPFYNKGHEAWVNGDLTPFLPGEKAYELKLMPN